MSLSHIFCPSFNCIQKIYFYCDNKIEINLVISLVEVLQFLLEDLKLSKSHLFLLELCEFSAMVSCSADVFRFEETHNTERDIIVVYDKCQDILCNLCNFNYFPVLISLAYKHVFETGNYGEVLYLFRPNCLILS